MPNVAAKLPPAYDKKNFFGDDHSEKKNNKVTYGRSNYSTGCRSSHHRRPGVDKRESDEPEYRSSPRGASDDDATIAAWSLGGNIDQRELFATRTH